MRGWKLAAGWILALVLGCDGGGGSPEPDGSVPASRPAEAPLTQWVDPFIGTGGLGFGVGSAFPGPQRPYGMARPGPDTTGEEGAVGFYHCSGYYYGDALIRGFSQIRPHGMGVPDYGAVGLMPTVGMSADKTTQRGYRSAFSHDAEEASPGYYAVTLDDTDIRTEITSTDRAAVYRVTYPSGSDAVLLFDMGHFAAEIDVVDGSVTVDAAEGEVHGFAHIAGGYSGRFGGVPVHFVARFSRPFDSHGVWKAGELFEGESTRDGPDTGAYLRFDTSADSSVELAIGLSFVDVAHARMNLEAEVPSIDFASVRADAEQAWEEALSRVEIEGRREEDFRLFYTALYHVLLMPTRADDVDGSYRGLDGAVHTAEGFRYYTDFSLWDTYRTQHPLLALLYPDYQRDFLRSLEAMARDGGYMPRWPLGIGYTGGMVGESATVVFADSWAKGVRDFDLRAVYDAMRSTAMGPTPSDAPYGGRSAIEAYLDLGYVPADLSGGAASRTLEYAYDDFALGTLAEALGETADADAFAARAGNWRNLYQEESGFLVGRNQDGSFAELNPLEWEDYYTEGNAYQYGWFVPHDLPGLAEAMGGREALLDRLQDLFERSEQEVSGPGPRNYYWHGNEPDIHYPWIWSALDRPGGTARWSRWVYDTMYGTGPDGLPGNDDAGTLSAWLVFDAFGLFPIAGTDIYLVGSPVLTRAVLHLEGGDFEIAAPDTSDEALYVTGARLGGEVLDRARIPHAEVAGGGRLELEMASEPDGWGNR